MAPGPTNSGLRSRKVDHKKSLPVYRYHEVPDFDETSSINRAIPTIATGVEKEEEEEHHLQAALIATQSGFTHNPVVIPTPDASKQISNYEHFYTRSFQQPKSLIRFSTQIDDVIGCPYNLDEEDDEFRRLLEERVKKGELVKEVLVGEDQFEEMVWALERAGNDKVLFLPPLIEILPFEIVH
ncbi:Enhancer of polycomb-like protein 1 [Rhizophlyctis rosea]|uniref:Enhancer of polycomb-like protein n=1 Tax=Rhizophlyctis rosea TaxID=64517 RepID=A0AAD5S2H5_9FUNG|nr:Enhancer of polycomb-like protein 1 [Rhizophlyctis rosea]